MNFKESSRSRGRARQTRETHALPRTQARSRVFSKVFKLYDGLRTTEGAKATSFAGASFSKGMAGRNPAQRSVLFSTLYQRSGRAARSHSSISRREALRRLRRLGAD